jgi:hypothetical protein
MPTDLSHKFATEFDSKFRCNTGHLLRCREIPLFRALASTFKDLSRSFKIEEYHGSGHQVSFTGDGHWARCKSRCELCDLLIIVFSESAKEVRATFLQAKSERSKFTPACQKEFSANTEQWYLLAKHPAISGVTATFNPPQDLLSGSLLPSVGSFGFFYKDIHGEFQIYYVSADYLFPTKVYHGAYKRGKVKSYGACCTCRIAGYSECKAASGNYLFAKNLYQLQIGTPINDCVSIKMHLQQWFVENLNSLPSIPEYEHEGTSLAKKIVRIFDGGNSDKNDSVGCDFGAKRLIIIQSDYKN